MDQAFLLQKQVRENSQDLQNEFLDMEAWEEQMKKKDLEIRNTKNDQKLPAVRSKIKKKCVPTTEVFKDEKPKKTKRTGPMSYDAWDKFDVEKACEEIDGSNKLTKTKKIYEVPSEEELDKEYAKAVIFKNEGNVLVKEQQYAKAVGKYSEAIKIFPHDATFYANRALCQLKLNNLYSAEGDCTTAIQLDKFYVKAYHRRATARIELKRYNDAQKDLEILLKLDSSNKEAKSMLASVKKKIENSKPLIISGEDIDNTVPIEKTIGEKLFAKSAANSKKDKNSEKSNASTLKDEKSSKKEPLKQSNESIENKKLKISENNDTSIKNNVTKTSKEKENDGPELPFWLPKLKKDVNIVYPVLKPPNQSNQKLKRIIINEISTKESIFQDIEEVNKKETLQPVTQPEDSSKINNIKELETKTNNVKICNTNNAQAVKSFPPPPKSSVGFVTNWRKNTCSEFRRKYLKQITPKNIPDIFKESMESQIFSEILSILNTEFISKNDDIYDLLIYFAQVKRFRALILFMTKEDKEALKNLFKYCKSKESKTDEEIKHLCSMYEM